MELGVGGRGSKRAFLKEEEHAFMISQFKGSGIWTGLVGSSALASLTGYKVPDRAVVLI